MTNKEDIKKSIKGAVKSELTDTQQQAKNVLISIITTLEDASVIDISKEEKPKFSAADVPDEVWELFIKDNLTAKPELNKKENYYDFLRRHCWIFLEINNLININTPENKRVSKLLHLLEIKKWYKLFRILNGYTEVQQEAEKNLISILTILEDASIVVFSSEENKNKFLANDKEANKGWELFVKINLTENPKLENNETFHDFIRRHQSIFLEINKLKNTKIPEGEEIFQLLYQLIEENWEKLFCTVLNCYVNRNVRYKKGIKLFDINDKNIKYNGRTMVHAVVRKNNTTILRELLKYGANLEITIWTYSEIEEVLVDDGGYTPLQDAAISGSYKCMEILLKENVDVNASGGNFQETALHFAADGGFIKCLKLLVDNRAKLDAKDSKGRIPYQLAQEKGHQHCMQYLAVAMQRQEISLPGSKSSKEEELNAVELQPMSVSITTPTKALYTDIPLHHAVSSDDLALILSFLDISSIKNMRLVNRFFSTLAKESYMWENYVKEKLTANPQLQWGESFYNFLKRQEPILSIYLKSKQTTLDGSTLFVLLCDIATAGWEKLFITVLKNYPSFNVDIYRDKEVRTRYLIHYAVRQNSTVMLAELIKRGASLKKNMGGYSISGNIGRWVNELGNNPLQEAVVSNAQECVSMLLDNKDKFNINELTADNDKQSALHIAAEKGDLISIELLVTHGARLYQKNGKGNIPYQVAQLYEHEECANYLAKQMQEKNIPIPQGSSCVLQ